MSWLLPLTSQLLDCFTVSESDECVNITADTIPYPRILAKCAWFPQDRPCLAINQPFLAINQPFLGMNQPFVALNQPFRTV